MIRLVNLIILVSQEFFSIQFVTKTNFESDVWQQNHWLKYLKLNETNYTFCMTNKKGAYLDFCQRLNA